MLDAGVMRDDHDHDHEAERRQFAPDNGGRVSRLGSSGLDASTTLHRSARLAITAAQPPALCACPPGPGQGSVPGLRANQVQQPAGSRQPAAVLPKQLAIGLHLSMRTTRLLSISLIIICLVGRL